MKRTLKQIISLVLAVCMVLTMLPTVTYAAEGDFTHNGLNYKVLTEDADEKTGTVALVGGTNWSSLSVAEAVYNSDINYTVTQVGDGINSVFPLASNMGDITISDTVTTIADYAFQGAAIDSITLGNSLEAIGKRAFGNIQVLASVDIPDSVTTIGEGAFSYPRDLEQVTFGASSQLETIGYEAFKSCKITEISIPDSVTTLGVSSFAFCEELTTATIGSGIKDIGASAFSGCTKLADLQIGSSVETIGASAFSLCTGLIDINIPNTVTTIGAYAFSSCTELLTVAIPSSVKEIGECAFRYSNKLDNVTIPQSVETMGSKIFEGCTGLKNVSIGNIIGQLMFNECTGLESVTIPDSVRTIGGMAFYNCTNLESATFLGDVPATITNNIFDSCTSLDSIYVPSGKVDAYKEKLTKHTDIIKPVEPEVLPPIPINTAEGLKAALEATTSSTINVMTDIELTAFITLGASHTLNIADGVTISTRGAGSYDCLLNIPQDMTMTLTGSDTLKSDNAGTTGISVWGTLQLEPGSKLLAANSGASGISLSAYGSPGRLVSNGGHIILQNSGEYSIGISSNIYESEVSLSGGTLTVSNSGNNSCGIKGVNLSATDGCVITVNSSNGDMLTTGIFVTSPIALQNCTLTIANTAGDGLWGSLSADTSTVTVKNSGSDGSGITISMGYSLDLMNNSTLNLENTAGTGLLLSLYSSTTVDGSTVNVKNDGGMGFVCNMPDLFVTGSNSGRFMLSENAKLSKVKGLLCDQGFVCNTSNDITVGAVDASLSEDGLTAGEYVWDGTHFTKIISPSLIEITGFSPIPNVNVGKAGNALCADALAVMTVLPFYASAIHSGTQKLDWPIASWEDTDGYNPAVAGSYTFTAALSSAPTGFTNSTGYKFTVEVVVSPADVSGGSSSGRSSGSTTTTTPGNSPDQPITAIVGANGAASAAIPEKSITDAIAKAQGNTAKDTTVALNVTMPQGATSLATTLTGNSLNSLVSAGVSKLELNGAPVSLGLDLKALQEIQKQSGGDISISIAPATGLSNEAKALLGNRPVYNISINYVKDGNSINLSSLGSGAATISIPYTPAGDEAVAYLFGVYVDANGNTLRIPGSAYDTNSGSLLIPTGHFSVYGVGYTAPSARFTDISSHWGKEAIDFVVGRGLFTGTAENTFEPNTAMTRGMLVTALGRLAVVDVKAYTTNSFTDVITDSVFHPYIEWAYEKGIVQGIGNRQFAPDRAITREEIAVIFANYAKATGCKLPVVREATPYGDADRIGSIYKSAVTVMQQGGIMTGGTDNLFNPKSSATRAEVSSMLYRYIKLNME